MRLGGLFSFKYVSMSSMLVTLDTDCWGTTRGLLRANGFNGVKWSLGGVTTNIDSKSLIQTLSKTKIRTQSLVATPDRGTPL